MDSEMKSLKPDSRLEVIGGGGIRNTIREKQLSFFKKSKTRISVELVERDLKVLEFILEMKFAGYSEVFEKFFSAPRSGGPTESMEWARKRLRQLEQSGFLKSEINPLGGPKLYVVNLKGYHALSRIFADRTIPKPTSGLDTRTFVHDRELLLYRLKMENTFGEVSWISDRSLKHGAGKEFGLSGADVPDGLMKVPNLGWVAVEVEIATKARQRYRDKVQFYLSLIRDRMGATDAIREVNFICMRKICFEILRDECSAYGNYISVELRKPSETSNDIRAPRNVSI